MAGFGFGLQKAFDFLPAAPAFGEWESDYRVTRHVHGRLVGLGWKWRRNSLELHETRLKMAPRAP